VHTRELGRVARSFTQADGCAVDQKPTWPAARRLIHSPTEVLRALAFFSGERVPSWSCIQAVLCWLLAITTPEAAPGVLSVIGLFCRAPAFNFMSLAQFALGFFPEDVFIHTIGHFGAHGFACPGGRGATQKAIPNQIVLQRWLGRAGSLGGRSAGAPLAGDSADGPRFVDQGPTMEPLPFHATGPCEIVLPAWFAGMLARSKGLYGVAAVDDFVRQRTA